MSDKRCLLIVYKSSFCVRLQPCGGFFDWKNWMWVNYGFSLESKTNTHLTSGCLLLELLSRNNLFIRPITCRLDHHSLLRRKQAKCRRGCQETIAWTQNHVHHTVIWVRDNFSNVFVGRFAKAGGDRGYVHVARRPNDANKGPRDGVDAHNKTISVAAGFAFPIFHGTGE